MVPPFLLFQSFCPFLPCSSAFACRGISQRTVGVVPGLVTVHVTGSVHALAASKVLNVDAKPSISKGLCMTPRMPFSVAVDNCSFVAYAVIKNA